MEKNIRDYIQEAINFLKNKFSRNNEELSYYLLIVFALFILVIGINLFLELTESLSGTSLKSYDRAITDFVISFRTPGLNKFFQMITEFGDFYGYLVATVVAALFFFIKFKNWKIIIELTAVTILAALSNIVLKDTINRARPSIEHLVVVKSLSYPSGHSMSAMAFYGFLIYLCFRIKMSQGWRVFLCLLFTFLILAIGVSRIYLGVHFPSDVLGGYMGGLIWIAFCVILFNIIDLLRKRKARESPKSEENENLDEGFES